MTLEGVTGVINAGGDGSRLGGAHKGLLAFSDGTTIIERTLRLFGDLFETSVIVANDAGPYRRFGVPVIPDAIHERGAPAGLAAALAWSPAPWIFFAACDMPALDASVIRALADARRAAAWACILTSDRAEPLHSFWSTAALPTIERQLRDGKPSFRDLLREIPHRSVGIDGVIGARESIANVNAPEDLARFGLHLAAPA